MVKKVFTVLGTAVGCIIAIAIVINVILPNGVAGLSNNIELAIKQATGAEIDFNGDGAGGANGRANGSESTDSVNADGLDGFSGTIDGGGNE